MPSKTVIFKQGERVKFPHCGTTIEGSFVRETVLGRKRYVDVDVSDEVKYTVPVGKVMAVVSATGRTGL